MLLQTLQNFRLASLCTLPVWLVIASISCRAFGEQTTSKQDEIRLDELNLYIVISSKFIASNQVTKGIGVTICQNLSEELFEDKGPWGFGLFSGRTRCELSLSESDRMKNKEANLSHKNLWELRIDLNEDCQGTLSLCRPLVNSDEKCEASVTIPTSKFLPQLLANRKFVRLLAASIIDQAPFRSKLSQGLAKSKVPLTPKNDEKEKEPFRLPPFKDELLPVAIILQRQNGLFNVKLRKETPSVLLEEKNIWLVTKKRAGMSKDLFLLISNATTILGQEEQRKADLNARASSIYGRNARRNAKAERSFLDRLETIAELRGGSSFASTKDNSVGTDLEVLLTEGIATNLWFETHLFRGNYQYQIALSNKTLGNSISTHATRTLFLGALGTGIRWSTDSDHTLFLFPKVEFGQMIWKADSLSTKLPAAYTDMSFTAAVVPGFGFTAGYQSPEKWPIGLQARIGSSAINSDNFSSFWRMSEPIFHRLSCLVQREANYSGLARFKQQS